MLGCGAARARKANALALAAADQRVREGCYDCLREARATFERLAVGKDATPIAVKLFETELLLALREKELALDWRATLQRARSMAARVPAALEPNRLIAIVDAVLPDGNGVPPKAHIATRRGHRALVERIDGELAWLASVPLTPAVREYVALAFDCSYWVRPRAPGATISGAAKRPELAPGASPLIAYRTGICAGTDTTMLERARAAVAAFPEAAYHLGSTAAFAAEETGGMKAGALLDEAYRRFPKSPAVTLMSGWLGTVIGDCSRAVRYYDETLAIEPAHENAWLQRTICLTNMRQDSAAIESATRLIALETESTAQAYYWRALNRLRRKELEQARSDIEAAKALAPASNVLTLAGIIEHDQDDLGIAERDLRTARGHHRGDENCTAAWYLGLVLTKTKRWGESAEIFEAAMGCYDLKVSDLRFKIARLMERSAANPSFAARRIAQFEADSAEQRGRYYAAAFNAAGSRASIGEYARGGELLEIAARNTKLAASVANLRESLKAVSGAHVAPTRRDTTPRR